MLVLCYVSDFHLVPSGFTLCLAQCQLIGSYVVSINNTPIYSLDDIHCALLQHSSLDHSPTTLEVPKCASSFDDWSQESLHLHLHDVCHIAALQSLDREGMPVNAQILPSNTLWTTIDIFKAGLFNINMAQFVHCQKHAGMMEEEDY